MRDGAAQRKELVSNSRAPPKTAPPRMSPLAFLPCLAALKIIAAIEEPPLMGRILAHLGLPSLSTTALARAPSRSHPSGLSL